MNYKNKIILHEELAKNKNKSSVKVPVTEYNDDKITFNTANKLTTLAFIKPILKMVNYTEKIAVSLHIYSPPAHITKYFDD